MREAVWSSTAVIDFLRMQLVDIFYQNRCAKILDSGDVLFPAYLLAIAKTDSSLSTLIASATWECFSCAVARLFQLSNGILWTKGWILSCSHTPLKISSITKPCCLVIPIQSRLVFFFFSGIIKNLQVFQAFLPPQIKLARHFTTDWFN